MKRILILTILLSVLMIPVNSNAQDASNDWHIINFNDSAEYTGTLAVKLQILTGLEGWHYPEGYWSFDTPGIVSNPIIIKDSDMDMLVASKGILDTEELDKPRIFSVALPPEVTDYLNNGGKTEELKIKFNSGDLPAGKLFKGACRYKIEGDKLSVVFTPIFNVSPDPIFSRTDDPLGAMKVLIPKGKPGFGYTTFSIWDKTGTHLGASHDKYIKKNFDSRYTSMGDERFIIPPYDIENSTGDIVHFKGDIVNSTGALNPDKTFYYVNEKNGSVNVLTSSMGQIGYNNSFAKGGAVGVGFYFPFNAEIYLPSPNVETNLTMVSVDAPDSAYSGQPVYLTANVHVTTAKDKFITTNIPITVVADGMYAEGVITPDAWNEKLSESTDGSFDVPALITCTAPNVGSNTAITVKAEVNPDPRQLSETTYDDNVLSKQIQIIAPQQPPSGVYINKCYIGWWDTLNDVVYTTYEEKKWREPKYRNGELIKSGYWESFTRHRNLSFTFYNYLQLDYKPANTSNLYGVNSKLRLPDEVIPGNMILAAPFATCEKGRYNNTMRSGYALFTAVRSRLTENYYDNTGRHSQNRDRLSTRTNSNLNYGPNNYEMERLSDDIVSSNEYSVPYDKVITDIKGKSCNNALITPLLGPINQPTYRRSQETATVQLHNYATVSDQYWGMPVNNKANNLRVYLTNVNQKDGQYSIGVSTTLRAAAASSGKTYSTDSGTDQSDSSPLGIHETMYYDGSTN